MHPEGKERSHALPLSLNETGNNLNLIASVKTLLSFNMSHTSKNTERCKLGSSSGVPLNWDCYTTKIRDNLSSKLWASTLGQAILEAMPWTLGVTTSRSILLSLSPPSAIVEDALELWLFTPLALTSFS